VPKRPWILVLDHTGHFLQLTYLKDWGDGKGPVPMPGAIAQWKQRKVPAPRGAPSHWLGFAEEDVAQARFLLRAANAFT
jgi:hypothetical protein